MDPSAAWISFVQGLSLPDEKPSCHDLKGRERPLRSRSSRCCRPRTYRRVVIVVPLGRVLEHNRLYSCRWYYLSAAIDFSPSCARATPLRFWRSSLAHRAKSALAPSLQCTARKPVAHQLSLQQVVQRSKTRTTNQRQTNLSVSDRQTLQKGGTLTQFQLYLGCIQ